MTILRTVEQEQLQVQKQQPNTSNFQERIIQQELVRTTAKKGNKRRKFISVSGVQCTKSPPGVEFGHNYIWLQRAKKKKEYAMGKAPEFCLPSITTTS